MSDKDRTLTKQECLELSVEVYNQAIKLTCIKDKKEVPKRVCKYCGRLMSVACICEEGEKQFQQTIDEVKAVSERNNNISND